MRRRLRDIELKMYACDFGENVFYMKLDSTGKEKFDAKWEICL